MHFRDYVVAISSLISDLSYRICRGCCFQSLVVIVHYGVERKGIKYRDLSDLV